MPTPESKRSSREITPETVSLIAAAVTAFLGKKVRTRSAKALPDSQAVGRWARQGRVMVQTSHNLGQGRR